MSDKDMVTVYERRDGSKPGLWSVYWYLGVGRVFLVLPRGGHHVKEYDDGHCSSVLSAGFSWTHRLAVEPSDLEHHRLSGAYQL